MRYVIDASFRETKRNESISHISFTRSAEEAKILERELEATRLTLLTFCRSAGAHAQNALVGEYPGSLKRATLLEN